MAVVQLKLGILDIAARMCSICLSDLTSLALTQALGTTSSFRFGVEFSVWQGCVDTVRLNVAWFYKYSLTHPHTETVFSDIMSF